MPIPNYYNPYQPSYYPTQMQQTSPQIQSNGFISVRSEMEARNYPVAPGNSITFKDENAPYVYTKTMGVSQLDTPSFEKYKLVKEDVINAQEQIAEGNKDIEDIKSDIDKIWGEINEIKSQQKTTTRKKDGDD